MDKMSNFKPQVDQFEWMFTGVYSDRDKWFLWVELSGLSSWWNILLYVGSDFNVVWFPSECFGSKIFYSGYSQVFRLYFRARLDWSTFGRKEFLLGPSTFVPSVKLTWHKCFGCVFGLLYSNLWVFSSKT